MSPKQNLPSLAVVYQNPNSLNVSQVSRYAAAAGAGLAMAGSADASIIYSGVQNITVQIDPAFQATSSINTSNYSTVEIDIDNDGDDDITAVAFNFGHLAGSSTVKYSGGAFLSANSSATFLNNLASTNADLLANSANVSANGHFSAVNAGQFRLNYVSSGAFTSNVSYGASFVSNTAFVGIQLTSGNFGWIRLLIEDLGPNQPFSTLLGGNPISDGLNFSDKITIVDWAFEDSGAAIHVGDTGRVVPEPSSLALLAAGAAGISAFRRRKNDMKA